jgi:hypothetical protein
VKTNLMSVYYFDKGYTLFFCHRSIKQRDKSREIEGGNVSVLRSSSGVLFRAPTSCMHLPHQCLLDNKEVVCY